MPSYLRINDEDAGSIAQWSISSSRSSLYLGENSASVPSASIDLRVADTHDTLYWVDQDAELLQSYAYPGAEQHLESTLLGGTVQAVNPRRTGDSVNLSISGEAERLNQDIVTYPIYKQDAAFVDVTGGQLLTTALTHWFAECGLYREAHPGQMLFQAVNQHADIAYYDSPDLRFSAKDGGGTTTTGYRRVWSPTDRMSNDQGFPFNVGDTVQLVWTYAEYDSAWTGKATVVTNLTAPVGAGDANTSAEIFTQFDPVTQAFTAYDRRLNSTVTPLFDVVLGSDTPTDRVREARFNIQVHRISATEVRYALRAVVAKLDTEGRYVVSTREEFASTLVSTLSDRIRIRSFEMRGVATDMLPVVSAYWVRSDEQIPFDELQGFGGHPINLLVGETISPNVTIPGVKGSAWTLINDLATLYGLTFDPVRMQLDPRPVYGNGGGQELNLSDTSISADSRNTAEYIMLSGHTAKAGDMVELWRADSTYSLKLGERQEHEIQLSGSAVRFDQPSLLAPEAVPVQKPGEATYSYYSVWGKDNHPMTYSEWVTHGGAVTVRRGETSEEAVLVLQAPADPAIAHLAPFVISLETEIPSLVIVGEGIRTEEMKHRIYTGAGTYPTREAPEYSNPLIVGTEVFWKAAESLAHKHGTTQTKVRTKMSPRMHENDSAYYAEWFRTENSMYLVTSGSLNRNSFSVSEAIRYTSCQQVDYEYGYGELTCLEIDTLYQNDPVRAVNMRPLRKRL